MQEELRKRFNRLAWLGAGASLAIHAFANDQRIADISFCTLILSLMGIMAATSDGFWKNKPRNNDNENDDNDGWGGWNGRKPKFTPPPGGGSSPHAPYLDQPRSDRIHAQEAVEKHLIKKTEKHVPVHDM